MGPLTYVLRWASSDRFTTRACKALHFAEEEAQRTSTWRMSKPRCLFYRDLFGFTETFRTPSEGEPIHVEMRLGGLILGVASIESARRVHGIDRGDGPPRGEVVVWTDDVDQAFASITAQEARPLSQPHNFLADLRAAWIADPDGNPVQMVMRRAE